MFKRYLKTDKENKFICVSLSYNKGGVNCFNYQNEPRGYYVHVQPVTRESHGGVTMESFVAFTGYKQLIREVGRASKKQEEICDGIALDCARPIIQRVLEESGMKITEEY